LKNGNYVISESVTEIIAFSRWGFALVGVVVLFVRYANKKMYINDYSPIEKKERIPGAFSNSPFIAFASLTGFFILLNYQSNSSTNSEEAVQSMVKLFFK
jgi:hypothetical protein